jgi:sec-independent protein translocase protein TatC
MSSYDYPDDIFADTRMTFGEHIEELRFRMLQAIKGLLFFLVIGFVLDGLGSAIDNENPPVGLGRVVMGWITEPVETQVRAFYFERNRRAKRKLEKDAQEAGALQKWIPMSMRFSPAALDKAAGREPVAQDDHMVELIVEMKPAEIEIARGEGEDILQSRKYLTTLSVQEGFVVYFKVSLLAGVVLGSPWIIWQFWAFVGAGLYPHEKKYVYRYMPFSLGLFLAGVFLCQFLVLPGAVKALLAFNQWLDLDPDIRLNEWLGFAIILPLVFGVSFQTPLVMLFFERIGVFDYQFYLKQWRYAVMILALFSALLTPTPDAVTMLYLFVPMFGLYMLGVAICKYYPSRRESEVEEEEEVAV